MLYFLDFKPVSRSATWYINSNVTMFTKHRLLIRIVMSGNQNRYILFYVPSIYFLISLGL